MRETVRKSGKVFALTHNYTGYPMVKEARELVRSGNLGKILKIVAEYPQGWLLTRSRRRPEAGGLAARTRHAGAAVAWATSALTRKISAATSPAWRLRNFVPSSRLLSRKLSKTTQYAPSLPRRSARHPFCSQISCGEENNLNIRVYGTQASLAWQQEHPNELTLKFTDEPRRIFRRGNGYVSEKAKKFTRLPFGHPEAFIEAFANIYLEAAAPSRPR